MSAPAPTAIALTIAGSDSSGGAGIQADLKTFSAFGVYGAAVLTALTAQNTQGVQAVEAVAPAFVARQIESVLSDLDVGAIKTGMLANAAIIAAVVETLGARPPRPLVVDPVMVATSGDLLLDPAAVSAVRDRLLPIATLITPNLPEAAALLAASVAGSEEDIVAQARGLHAAGARAVLIKGGHGRGETAVDVLFDGTRVTRFTQPRLSTPHTHGTGCTLSAAIAALMAQGVALEAAVGRAKIYVWKALESGQFQRVGHGRGPVDHLYAIRKAPPPA